MGSALPAGNGDLSRGRNDLAAKQFEDTRVGLIGDSEDGLIDAQLRLPVQRLQQLRRWLGAVGAVDGERRPTSSQCPLSTSILCASSGEAIRLQASAYCATSLSVLRSPPPPIRIGGCG